MSPVHINKWLTIYVHHVHIITSHNIHSVANNIYILLSLLSSLSLIFYRNWPKITFSSALHFHFHTNIPHTYTLMPHSPSMPVKVPNESVEEITGAYGPPPANATFPRLIMCLWSAISVTAMVYCP
jgi:hypothetical protein